MNIKALTYLIKRLPEKEVTNYLLKQAPSSIKSYKNSPFSDILYKLKLIKGHKEELDWCEKLILTDIIHNRTLSYNTNLYSILKNLDYQNHPVLIKFMQLNNQDNNFFNNQTPFDVLLAYHAYHFNNKSYSFFLKSIEEFQNKKEEFGDITKVLKSCLLSGIDKPINLIIPLFKEKDIIEALTYRVNNNLSYKELLNYNFSDYTPILINLMINKKPMEEIKRFWHLSSPLNLFKAKISKSKKIHIAMYYASLWSKSELNYIYSLFPRSKILIKNDIFKSIFLENQIQKKIYKHEAPAPNKRKILI